VSQITCICNLSLILQQPLVIVITSALERNSRQIFVKHSRKCSGLLAAVLLYRHEPAYLPSVPTVRGRNCIRIVSLYGN